MEIFVYRKDSDHIDEGFMPEKLTELLANDENLVWIDMEKPNDDENRVLSKVFNFHPLTIEDAIDWKLLEEKIL